MQDHYNELEYDNETIYRTGLSEIQDINGYRVVFRAVIESDFCGEENQAGSHYKRYGMNMTKSGSTTVQYLMKYLVNYLKKLKKIQSFCF